MSDQKKSEWMASIYKKSRIIFPIIAIVALAFTITFALNLSNKEKKLKDIGIESSSSESAEATEETSMKQEPQDTDVPMSENTDERIAQLVGDFFAARAEGDEERILTFCDEIDDINLYRYGEFGKYIDHYGNFAIYTQPGLLDKTYLVYVYFTIKFIGHEEEVPGYQTFFVCTREDDSLYFKRGEISDVESEYISRVMAQEDVVEFSNRVYAEYTGLLKEKPEILAYMDELTQQVNITVGVRLGQENAGNADDPSVGGDNPENPGESGEPSEENQNPPEPSQPTTPVKVYVVTTVSANVRESDSEKAQRIGTTTKGMKLELLEEQVNGWSKVVYEKKTGYIKTEFLEKVLDVSEIPVIGKITATTTVNVRSAADQNSTRMGVLAKGTQADLFSEESGWCRINYNGQVGYVKSDYVKKDQP